MRFYSSYINALLAIFQLHLTLIKGAADVCGDDKVAENQLTLQSNSTITILINNYKRATCAWKVTAPPGYNVAVTITNDLWSGDGCDKQNLKIYDGASSSDKLLAEFCTTKPAVRSRPMTTFSSDANARVELKTGNSSSNVAMVSFMVKAVQKPKQACTNGIVLKLAASPTVSNFTSPYYPLGYPQNASCGWLIEAPPGKIIKLSFTNIGLHCFGDVLTVYDGESDNAEDLFKQSCSFVDNVGFTDNDVIYSYGQKLYVTFKTDNELDSKAVGFRAVYSAVDSGRECIPGASSQANIIVAANPTGDISSPGFPTSIPNELFTCTWRMKAPEGQVVKLNFNAVNLKYRSIQDYMSCKRSLKVFSGIGPESYEVVQVGCDDLLFQTIASTGRRMEIVYTQESKHTERPKGFSMDYSTIPLVKTGSCGANQEDAIQLTGDAATFNSPHYPSYVPANMTCRWNITVTAGQVIELYTDTSTFNFRASKDCTKEYVRIYDGSTIASPLLAQVCPREKKHVFSSSNRIIVEFFTTGKTDSKGFSARYAARIAAPKPYACSGVRSRFPDKLTTSGKLASHRFPLMYSNNARCSWSLEAPFGYFVNLSLSSLYLEADSSCSKDFLLLESEGWNLAKLCGKKKTPVSYLSKNNKMDLTFWADATGRYPGFEATFDSVKDHSFGNCTQQSKNNIIPMTSSSGTIFSPRYPNYYPPDITCTWDIEAPKDRYVRLSFNEVRLKACGSSSIEIRDKASNKLVSRLCEYPNTPFIIFSSGSGLVVQFKSAHDTYTNVGFTADYQFVSQLPQSISCGENSRIKVLEDSSSGSIASYEYPLKYQNDVECMWIIKTSSSYRYKVKFDFIDIEPSPGCKDDYVVVRDGRYSFSAPIGQFCGNTIPESLTSSESAIYVEFKTNGTGKYPGFKMSFERKYNVHTTVLIAVFSTIGGVGAIGLIGWLIFACCCGDDDETETAETVNLQQVEEEAAAE